MKHRNILTLILLLATLTLAAQNNYSPCYTDNIANGDKAYKQGKYNEAKTYYVKAKQCNGGNPTVAQQKINSCDEKINAKIEAEEAKRKADEAAEAKRKAEEAEAKRKTEQEAAEAKRKAEQEAAEVKRKAEAAARQRAIDEAKSRGYEYITVNGVTFKMVYVQGGTFTMGCTSEQGGDCDGDEKPSHQVTLSDYWIGETEVTQALWEAVMGTTVGQQRDKENVEKPLKGIGANYPMYFIDWNEAVEFCDALNIKLANQLPLGCRFALPTEAQWEYAARGGSKSRHYKYSGSNIISEVAWCYLGNEDDWWRSERSDLHTRPVKTKSPNELGLYDMSGNVWEWCSDWSGNYDDSSQINPEGPFSGRQKICRGGHWAMPATFCRVSSRLDVPRSTSSYELGIRLVLVRQ